MTKTIKINILTRTSGRPHGFTKCYSSIKQQTYKQIRHIVSYEDEDSRSYLEGLDIDIIHVSDIEKSHPQQEIDTEGNLYAPYNLYCNMMLQMVDDGWIMFLDDDDHLFHNKVIEELVAEISSYQSEEYLFIWQMRYPNGRILPSNEMIKKQLLLKNNIGSPCFVFHSKYKDNVKWDAFKAADFRFLEQLIALIPHKVWLQKIGVQINNYGDLGKKNDIKIEKKGKSIMPIVFYKNILWYFIPKYHLQILGIYIFHIKTYKKWYNNLVLKLKSTF